MINQKGLEPVAKTAMIMNEWRFEDESAKRSSFDDPFAKYFSNEASRALAKEASDKMPEGKEMLRARTRYIDRTLTVDAHSGVFQVLTLGAGLDSRPMRLIKHVPAATRFFEMDQESVVEFKQKKIQEADIFVNSQLVAADYVNMSAAEIEEKLSREGFNSSYPTLVIWEGTSEFLKIEDVKSVLQKIRGLSLTGLTVLLDYIAPSVVSRTSGVPEATRLAEFFDKMGSPWLSGIDDIQQLASEAGYEVVENYNMSELKKKFSSADGCDKEIYQLYSVAKLKAIPSKA